MRVLLCPLVSSFLVYKAKSDELKKIIGFPTTWTSTEFLKGREWWVSSKKKGEGGPLEDYQKTYPFENYEVRRRHLGLR